MGEAAASISGLGLREREGGRCGFQDEASQNSPTEGDSPWAGNQNFET